MKGDKGFGGGGGNLYMLKLEVDDRVLPDIFPNGDVMVCIPFHY